MISTTLLHIEPSPSQNQNFISLISFLKLKTIFSFSVLRFNADDLIVFFLLLNYVPPQSTTFSNYLCCFFVVFFKFYIHKESKLHFLSALVKSLIVYIKSYFVKINYYITWKKLVRTEQSNRSKNCLFINLTALISIYPVYVHNFRSFYNFVHAVYCEANELKKNVNIN